MTVVTSQENDLHVGSRWKDKAGEFKRGKCLQPSIFVFTVDSHISIELVSKQVKVSRDMAIFVTMNPGYAGRSNLPDNLKKLFRSLAMTSPDRQLIAQVMLYSQGFRMAEKLASKIVPFFK
jgi:ABC-type multidrug transport system permease subunit